MQIQFSPGEVAYIITTQRNLRSNLSAANIDLTNPKQVKYRMNKSTRTHIISRADMQEMMIKYIKRVLITDELPVDIRLTKLGVRGAQIKLSVQRYQSYRRRLEPA